MILFLDDETDITDIYCKLIERKYGFEVDAFNSPEDALAAFEKSPELYDVMIVDYQMPGMDGLKFSQKIREKNKNTKIIICTGDPGLISAEAIHENNLFSVLKKPLRTDEMAEKIQAAREENQI
jgi:DNA-binding NtrC family response regulator